MQATRTAGRPAAALPRPLRSGWCVLATLPLLFVHGCQGDFTRPALANPNDPEVGQLPLAPVLERVCLSDCDGEGQSPRLEVTWSVDSEAGIVEYQLFRSTSADIDPGDLVLHVPAGNRSVLDSGGLVENQTYVYRVRAVDEAGRLSLRSAPVEHRPSCSRPCP